MKLQCRMVPDSEADKTLACEGALQTSPFPRSASARLPVERPVVLERCTLSTQLSKHHDFPIAPLHLHVGWG